MATNAGTSRLQHKRDLERHFADDFSTLAYPLLANAYYQEGDMVRARKVCRIGLKHHPDHGPGLFVLALVNMREGQMEEAEQLLDRTLAQDPYHVEAAEYLVAIQERLKRPPGVLERAYKILLLANPLSQSARARLKRMQAEKELVLKVKREMRLREAAAREPMEELKPLMEVERPAKETDEADSEPAPFVPIARLSAEPPVDIRSDEEAERAERIGARLEQSDQLTEAERAWERHIEDVATELAQTQQLPEGAPGPEPSRFPLEDIGAAESDPATNTTVPEADKPPEQAAPEGEGAVAPLADSAEAISPAPADDISKAEETAVEDAPETMEDQPWPGEEDEAAELEPWPGKGQAEEITEDVKPVEEAVSTETAADGEEAVTAARVEDPLTAAEPAVEGASAPVDDRPWPGEEDEAAELEPWPEKEQVAEQAEDVTPAEEAVSAEPAADSDEAATTAPADESLIAAEPEVEGASEPVDDRPWPGEEDEAAELEPWPGKEQVAEQAEDVTPAEETVSPEPVGDRDEAVTTAPAEESLATGDPAMEETTAPPDDPLWPGEEKGGAGDLDPWPEPTATAETEGESAGAAAAESALEGTPTAIEEPALEVEPENEIVAAGEPPEPAAAKDELAPDFIEDLPPEEEPGAAKVTTEGGDEEEDAWATYLKPENVLGDDSLTVEAEILAEGQAPSVGAELDDLEKELTREIDLVESEPGPVEPEPAVEPEIESAPQADLPVVPADEEPPGLSIAARLAQLRVELSAKYAPEEPPPPVAPKKKSKPKVDVTPPSGEASGKKAGGDAETEPMAEVETKIEPAGALLEKEISPPVTAEETGEPPTGKPEPIPDRLSRLRKEIARDETREQVAGPELKAGAPENETEAEAVKDTGTAAVDQAAPVEPSEVAEEPAGDQSGAEPMVEEDLSPDEGPPTGEAGDDQPSAVEPPEVAEVIAGEQSAAEPIIEEDLSADEGQSAEEASEPPPERSSAPTDTTASPFVDPILATFTLVDIYQVQGLYRQALQALDILANKGGDPERIKRQRATITAAMSSGSKSE